MYSIHRQWELCLKCIPKTHSTDQRSHLYLSTIDKDTHLSIQQNSITASSCFFFMSSVSRFRSVSEADATKTFSYKQEGSILTSLLWLVIRDDKVKCFLTYHICVCQRCLLWGQCTIEPSMVASPPMSNSLVNFYNLMSGDWFQSLGRRVQSVRWGLTEQQ